MAFYDTRIPSFPSVVFNTMYIDERGFKKDTLKTDNLTINLYSLLNFKNDTTLCVPLAYWTHNEDKSITRKNITKTYYNYIFRTDIPITESPLHGQISLSPSCDSPSKTIPIKDGHREDKVYTYGVCLHKVLHSYDLTTSPELLVHWIELNLALGVQYMTVYLQPGIISNSYYTSILPYIKRGVIEVLDWGFQTSLISQGYTKTYWGQSALITECIYRNMYNIKYLGLYGIDEFIVPQKLKTIPKMIKEVEKNQSFVKASGYKSWIVSFYNRKKSLPEVKTHSMLQTCPAVTLPRYYTHTARNYYKYITSYKLIVKPKAVISIGIHKGVKSLDNYTKLRSLHTRDVITHCYRQETIKCKVPKIITYTMRRYFNDTINGIINNTCI